MELNQTVYQEDSGCHAAACVVAQDEDQDASTQIRDGEQEYDNVLQGQTKGLFACLDGLVYFFQQIFSCQDADGDDVKDPLLENPNPQGQVQVETGSTDLGANQNGPTAESRGLTQSVTSELFRRPRGPKSPGVNAGSGPQHNFINS